MIRKRTLALAGVLGVGVVVAGGLAGASILFLRSTAGRFLRDVLAGVLENSAPADVARTRPFSRARYVLEYPGNWRLDDDDHDFDPDRFVDLNAPGQGKVMLILMPPGRADFFLRKAKANYVRMIMGHVRERPFTRWGRYEGTGSELAGFLMVAPGRIRIFAHEAEPTAFAVVEIRYDGDESYNAAGYDLIERSFEIR